MLVLIAQNSGPGQRAQMAAPQYWQASISLYLSKNKQHQPLQLHTQILHELRHTNFVLQMRIWRQGNRLGQNRPTQNHTSCVREVTEKYQRALCAPLIGSQSATWWLSCSPNTWMLSAAAHSYVICPAFSSVGGEKTHMCTFPASDATSHHATTT